MPNMYRVLLSGTGESGQENEFEIISVGYARPNNEKDILNREEFRKLILEPLIFTKKEDRYPFGSAVKHFCKNLEKFYSVVDDWSYPLKVKKVTKEELSIEEWD